MAAFGSPQLSMPFDELVGKAGPGLDVCLFVSLVHIRKYFSLH